MPFSVCARSDIAEATLVGLQSSGFRLEAVQGPCKNLIDYGNSSSAITMNVECLSNHANVMEACRVS